MNTKPYVLILCGLPGSGKTTLAKELETQIGLTRFTLDEELFSRFGKDFRSDLYDQYEQQTKKDLLLRLKDKIENKKSVILDYGFWKKKERDFYKKYITHLGANYMLLYLKVEKGTLAARISERNKKNSDQNHIISADLMEKFINLFEEPINEEEKVVSDIKDIKHLL